MSQIIIVEIYVGIGVNAVELQQYFLLVKQIVGHVKNRFVYKITVDYPVQLLMVHSEIRIVYYVVVP